MDKYEGKVRVFMYSSGKNGQNKVAYDWNKKCMHNKSCRPNVCVGDVISLINYACDESRNEYTKYQCPRIERTWTKIKENCHLWGKKREYGNIHVPWKANVDEALKVGKHCVTDSKESRIIYTMVDDIKRMTILQNWVVYLRYKMLYEWRSYFLLAKSTSCGVVSIVGESVWMEVYGRLRVWLKNRMCDEMTIKITIEGS